MIDIARVGITTSKNGEKLDVDGAYLDATLNEAITTATRIAVAVVCQMKKSSSRQVVETAATITSHLPRQGFNSAAVDLATFLLRDHHSRMQRRSALELQLEQWRIERDSREPKDIKEDVRKLDVSGLSRIYTMKKHVLLEDFESALEEIRRLLEQGEISTFDLRTDRLYYPMREHNGFRQVSFLDNPKDDRKISTEAEGSTQD